jgi:hypothetical protein
MRPVAPCSAETRTPESPRITKTHSTADTSEARIGTRRHKRVIVEAIVTLRLPPP